MFIGKYGFCVHFSAVVLYIKTILLDLTAFLFSKKEYKTKNRSHWAHRLTSGLNPSFCISKKDSKVCYLTDMGQVFMYCDFI